MKSTQNEPVLSWMKQDIEQRLAFKGGRHTKVNNFLAFLIGLVLCVLFYAVLFLFPDTYFADMFTKRGFVPYVIMVLSGWSLATLFLKWRKMSLQRRCLQLTVVPTTHDFVLSTQTVNDVLRRIHGTVDDPRHFILLNRIVIALSNLRNLGRVTDVDEILRSQAELDESDNDTSYLLISGFVWAIPVLGFIGTVLGLSVAIGGFGKVLSSSEGMEAIKTSLQSVTGGLATAFETTLVALVMALCIQMLLTFMRKTEQEFLDQCTDYCFRNVVSKLRMMPYQADGDSPANFLDHQVTR